MTEQNIEKWKQDRCGNITASRNSDVLLVKEAVWKVLRKTGTTLKVCASEQEATEFMDADQGHSLAFVPGAPLKGYENYVQELVTERLTHLPHNTPDTYQMKWGHDNEPFAKQAYEIRTGTILTNCGFIKASPETGLVNYGASPDDLVGMDGQIEVKCPVNSVLHLRCFHDGGNIPEEHHPQLEGQLIATGRDWVDFCSYDPRFVNEWQHLQLYVQRYTSNPELRARLIHHIAMMDESINGFIEQLPKAA